MFVDLNVIVPVGPEYNGYEKLLLPFDILDFDPSDFSRRFCNSLQWHDTLKQ